MFPSSSSPFSDPSLKHYRATKFDHQVAGHTNEMVRRFGPSCIIKPQNKPDLFARESAFYHEVFREKDSTPRFFPRFFGLVDVEDESESGGTSVSEPETRRTRPCIVLEDFTLHYSQPSMIDIKMGRQTFEPNASPEKVARELKKYPHQQDIGFRITGLKVWDVTQEQYTSFDKWFGRSMEPSNVLYGLAFYFFDGEGFRTEVIRDMMRTLHDILAWMRQQTRYKFFCSSILVVYDSDDRQQQHRSTTTSVSGMSSEADSTPSSPDGPAPICRVGMIDFAHVCINSPEVEEVDEGYIFGVISLMDHLKQLLEIVHHEQESMVFIERMRSFISGWSPRGSDCKSRK